MNDDFIFNYNPEEEEEPNYTYYVDLETELGERVTLVEVAGGLAIAEAMACQDVVNGCAGCEGREVVWCNAYQ